ncbi:hypothetical protein [Microbulbifer sp. VAAF005]|uniref:hypothetical protein n=1 Tax=Microbulbifer sp. VAAF005 TaxID=3034230 RepID=UPI0024AD0A06|nr:hypothetical protein [Microbulbifer sp. VAAF005]WHI46558.1 hypothetical protein P0078_23105 [Microbulbifer sp. VAAF005]
MVDAKVKNRLQRGEDRYNSVLTENTVREARNLRKRGMKVKDIAKNLNVQPQTLGKAISGETWRHVV